ncbi:ABC transporter substrate-binding protein [Natronoglycomyces albus]|uniref:ABC transporter substrate-binding protein n=1 Tax=Natronoglycomyces albus TaxID=2811108 RepID=A0A895XH91_9ACTN|nr:ABC transporter substrate-binding protein [Natronoglycomyces albus]QSB04714.1 ABC transporter substrate-binding protein [Natronoglycomyces albus]
MKKLTAKKLLAVVAAGAVVATGACTADTGGGDGDGTFIFGVHGQPVTLDPVFTSEGETFRVTRQVFDTLLDHESGGNEIVPGLAEDYDVTEDGLTWTFNLREDVVFHDGAELTGDVVCANFDRWYNFPEPMQSNTVTYYWGNLFGSHADPAADRGRDNYAGCTADGLDVVIELNEVSANYPGAFSMATFGIISPDSLAQIDDTEMQDSSDPLPSYTQEVGVLAGTGPFQYSEWDHSAAEIKLDRFDDYWGEPAGVESIIFKAYDDETALKQALESGEIHGYDLVPPAHAVELAEAGYQVPARGVFNILYLAFQQDNEALADLEVREALAHAVNRQDIVDRILPEGGEVATQFMPSTLSAWSPDVRTFDYDPDTAQSMLADAGHEDLSLEFCWPTDISRPYMPSVQDIFESIKSDLEAVGVEIVEVPMQWNDYIPAANGGDCEMYLLGWTGDFNEGYNFLGTWFDSYTPEFGMDNDDVFDKLAEVDAEPDPDVRAQLLQEANVLIMDELPGLPISSSPPSIVFADNVNPPNISELTQEMFAEVSFK